MGVEMREVEVREGEKGAAEGMEEMVGEVEGREEVMEVEVTVVGVRGVGVTGVGRELQEGPEVQAVLEGAEGKEGSEEEGKKVAQGEGMERRAGWVDWVADLVEPSIHLLTLRAPGRHNLQHAWRWM